MSEYLIVCGDEVVGRTESREQAIGFAKCYVEHVGDECQIAAVADDAAAAEGGAA